MLSEGVEQTFYDSWKMFDDATLLGIRYELGIRLRSTYPRPAYPDYLYRQVKAVNRILNERGSA